MGDAVAPIVKRDQTESGIATVVSQQLLTDWNK